MQIALVCSIDDAFKTGKEERKSGYAKTAVATAALKQTYTDKLCRSTVKYKIISNWMKSKMAAKLTSHWCLLWRTVSDRMVEWDCVCVRLPAHKKLMWKKHLKPFKGQSTNWLWFLLIRHLNQHLIVWKCRESDAWRQENDFKFFLSCQISHEFGCRAIEHTLLLFQTSLIKVFLNEFDSFHLIGF